MITIMQTTSDTREELDELGQALVEQHLIACSQVEGPISSTNVWDGEVQSTEEYRITLKTTAACVADVETHIKEHHSYDLPEIISYEVTASTEYQKWVESETSR